MTRSPDNAQVQAVSEILQNHYPQSAGSALIARRIVTAVVGSPPPEVVLLVQLPSGTVAVLFGDVDEAVRWANDNAVPSLTRVRITSKEQVVAELWRSGQ